MELEQMSLSGDSLAIAMCPLVQHIVVLLRLGDAGPVFFACFGKMDDVGG